MNKETIQGHIVRGYDYFQFVKDCPDFEPNIQMFWERRRYLKIASLPYLDVCEKFYLPMEVTKFYKGKLTLEVGEGLGEPPWFRRAEFVKNILSIDKSKLELIGWIVRVVDHLGETLEYYLQYPGDGNAKGTYGPIFGFGMLCFFQITDMLKDCTPRNKPVPCKMTIERLK